jgi:hypothetical protein
MLIRSWRQSLLAVSGRLGAATIVVFAILLLVAPAGANLFVSSANTNRVLEYDGTTGAFVTAFVSTASGSLVDHVSL